MTFLARLRAPGARQPLFLLAGLIATSACTRENPAFRDSTTDVEGSSDTSDASDSVADEATESDTNVDTGPVTESTSETADTDTTDADTSDVDTSDTGPDPVCMEIPPHEDFLIYFDHATFDAAIECSTYKGNFFYAAETTTTELLMAGPCNEDCSACENNELALGFTPGGEGQEPETGEGTCVYIEAEADVENPVPSPENRCLFRRVTFWPAFGLETPLLVVSGDGVVPNSLAQVPGPDAQLPFSVQLGDQAQCGCEEVDWCCVDDMPPRLHKLKASGASDWAYPGETQELLWGGLTYEFINARSYDSGECDMPASVTWVLQAQDPSSMP